MNGEQTNAETSTGTGTGNDERSPILIRQEQQQYGLLIPVSTPSSLPSKYQQQSSHNHNPNTYGDHTTGNAMCVPTIDTGSRADSKISDGIIDVPIPRLVLRNLPYSQSQNRIQVKHNYNFIKIYKLIIHDWFHVLLRFPTVQSLSVLIFIWTLCLVIWAGMYVWIDRSSTGVECGLGPNGTSISFRGAFAFSLQTSTTGMLLCYCVYIV
jgi:hypothetical protein